MKQLDQEKVLSIVRQMEAVLVESDAEYQDALGAALYIAAVSANSMGISKEVFLANCVVMYEHDKAEQSKELQ